MSCSVVLIVGTRPEAIKLQPVAEALSRRGLAPAIVFTGQHPELCPAEYGLDGFALFRLGCSGQKDPHVHVGTVTKAVEPVIREMKSKLVLVQGDTSSALGGALAAAMAEVPVGHVEAGLRSHSRRQPWPEEEFRQAIDREADLLFAPTQLSAANLVREKVRGQIHVTGNTGIDALFARRARIGKRARNPHPHVLVTCHRRENWGRSLDSLAMALRMIAEEALASLEVVLHPNPELADRFRDRLRDQAGMALCPPRSHGEMLDAMARADLILSDSGGMQEEAAALGVPLLLLRNTTERPEGVACGAVELVGTDPECIVRAVRRRIRSQGQSAKTLPFGDGRASERIAAIIEGWLASPMALSRAITDCARHFA